MAWTIQNSIDLSKLYPLNNTKILIYSNFEKNKEVKQFFNAFKIPNYVIEDKLPNNNHAYFGKTVNFQNLYIIAGIIKSFGYKDFYYKSFLDERITLGSKRRKTLKQNKLSIRIDEILSLPFNTEISDLIKNSFQEPTDKIDVIDFGIKSGLIKEDELQKINIETEDENIKASIDKSDSEDSHDPYENFEWGGLRGEEAYIGYWNTD